MTTTTKKNAAARDTDPSRSRTQTVSMNHAEVKNAIQAAVHNPSRSKIKRKREVPLGIAEIAQLLDVKPATVNHWRWRRIFPHPEMTVGGSPAWWADTIIEWAEATGRRG